KPCFGRERGRARRIRPRSSPAVLPQYRQRSMGTDTHIGVVMVSASLGRNHRGGVPGWYRTTSTQAQRAVAKPLRSPSKGLTQAPSWPVSALVTAAPSRSRRAGLAVVSGDDPVATASGV